MVLVGVWAVNLHSGILPGFRVYKNCAVVVVGITQVVLISLFPGALS